MRIKILFFGLIILSGSFWYWYSSNDKKQAIQEISSGIIQAPSIESSPENPHLRMEYQHKMLASPQTGEIPDNIRSRELRYADYQRSFYANRANFRTFEIDNWKERGPINVGGRTRGVVIDINDENRLVAGGVSGGIWQSEQGGESWERITLPLSLHSVTSLAQDTRTGRTNLWYYGTGELVGNTARGGGAPFRGDGLLRSTDNGLTWQKIASTASRTPESFDNQYNYVWNIAIDPSVPTAEIVFAAVFGGIARTINGINWSIVLGSDFGFDTDINQEVGSFHTDVIVTPDGVVYASLSEFSNQETSSSPDRGLYRSTDKGVSWENITPAGWPPIYRRTVIAYAPSDPNILYYLVDKGDQGGEIWRLDDNPTTGVATWDDRSENIPAFGGALGDYDAQNSYNMVVKVHPDNPDIVFIGGTNLYRSTDGYATSENTDWIGGYDVANDNSLYPGHHPDQHELLFYPSNSNRVLSSHDGGLSITNNILADSVIWTKINNQYITSQFYTIAMDETGSSDIVLGGMQDNGTYISFSDDTNTPWSRVIGGDGAFTEISRDALYYYVSFQNSQIFRLTFDEQFSLTSFARVDPVGGGLTENQEYLFINPFILDPNNSNIMYLAGGDMVWRNRNLSQIPSGSNDRTSINWTPFTRTRVGEGVYTALAASTQPKDVVYAGTSQRRLIRIENAASPDPSFSDITAINDFPSNGYISSISVDPTNANNVLVAFSNYEVQSLFYSQDGGNSFEAVSGDLEEFPDGTGNGPSVRWVKVIPLEGGEYVYLAATSTGLYSSSELDGMNTSWMQESPDLIGNKVVTMIKYRESDGKVVVATHGSGVYEATINSTAQVAKDIGELSLSINNPYPNPFQNVVNIPYSLPENELISIQILNTLGQPVKTLFTGTHLSGSHIASWDGTNSSGVAVPDGIYICSIIFRDRRVSSRVILTRTQ